MLLNQPCRSRGCGQCDLHEEDVQERYNSTKVCRHGMWAVWWIIMGGLVGEADERSR
jgi:hypothetical protein